MLVVAILRNFVSCEWSASPSRLLIWANERSWGRSRAGSTWTTLKSDESIEKHVIATPHVFHLPHACHQMGSARKITQALMHCPPWSHTDWRELQELLGTVLYVIFPTRIPLMTTVCPCPYLVCSWSLQNFITNSLRREQGRLGASICFFYFCTPYPVMCKTGFYLWRTTLKYVPTLLKSAFSFCPVKRNLQVWLHNSFKQVCRTWRKSLWESITGLCYVRRCAAVGLPLETYTTVRLHDRVLTSPTL